jgi:ubiquinol-cytochrome c reductase cytochrome b subunit
MTDIDMSEQETATQERRGAPTEGRAGRAGKRLAAALDERLGLSALQYPVPRHANSLAWTLGGLTLAALVILVVTGILLAQFYTPTPEAARDSVLHIETELQLGSLLRGIHVWAAQAMFVLVLAHLARVLITGSYKRPREANWLIGLGLLAMVFLLLFTGSTLRWDQEAFEAVEHNTALAGLVGGLGTWFTPEFGAGTPLVTRLYLAHVSFLPTLVFLLLVAHFMLIRRHGISARAQIPVGGTDPDERVPFTTHLRHLTGWSLILLGILVALAATTSNPVGPAPVAGIEVTKPLWPFLWLYQLENWIGIDGLFWAPVVVFLLLAALPFLDRSPERRPGRRRWVIGGALVVFGVLALFTLLVAFSGPAAHLG